VELLLQLLFNGVVVGAVYGLLAVGFGLIFTATRIFHFAHGAVYTLAGYIVYSLTNTLGWPLGVAIAAAMIVCGVLSGAIEVLVYRPLRARRASPLVILIASLSILVLAQNLLAISYGNEIRSLAGAVVFSGFEVGPIWVTSIQLVTIATCAVLFGLLQLFLRYSRYGKIIRALANNYEAARIIGADADRAFVVTFVIGGILVVPAAVLVGMLTGLKPFGGTYAVLMAAIAVIVGGMGSIMGAAPGALIVGISENLAVWRIATEWQTAVAFAVLLVFIVFKPTGFFGQRVRKMEV
jgi:branched-chain amino acid transport system permease protein